MTQERRRCPVCSGCGYTGCDCWPGDCICGLEQDCEYCEGAGWIETEDQEHDHNAPDASRPRAASTNIGE